MIHSLSGGVVKETEFFDFAKVKFDDGSSFWYICEIKNAKIGDFVFAPTGKNDVLVRAQIERIDRHINSQTSPFPIKRMKKITQFFG